MIPAVIVAKLVSQCVLLQCVETACNNYYLLATEVAVLHVLTLMIAGIHTNSVPTKR